MGLTDGLRRFATERPHLLIVEGAASARSRLAVERFAREQGWPLVDGPADADILVVAGRPEGLLVEYVDRLWEQLPGPRAQVQLSGDEGAAPAMLGARRNLADVAQQRLDVRRTKRPNAAMGGVDMAPEKTADPHAGHNMGGMDMGGMDMAPEEKADPHAGHNMGGMDMAPEDMAPEEKADPHAGHNMGGMDMAGMDMAPEEKADPHAGHNMGGMDMGGMDMAGMDMPGGLAMAERAPDRDGLKLDVLTVSWGPVLAWWPAGLVVTTVLQGDVVQEARVEQFFDLDANRAEWREALADLEPAVAAAVVRLDALVRLLAVAGWESARLQSQQVRDLLLSGSGDVAAQLHRLSRKVQRSRTLRRMTIGVGTTRKEDVAARYSRWLDETVAAVDSGSLPATADEPHAIHLLPALLVGSDVAATRLIVATLELALSGADVRPVASV